MAGASNESMPTGEPGGLPSETPKRTPWGKIAAVVIVLIVVIAGVVVWQLGQGAKETQPAITRVEPTSGTTGSVGSVGTAIGLRTTATGSIGSYQWDFGDDARANTTTNTTTHTYTVDGVYIIIVTVKSPGGLTATNDNSPLSLSILATTTPSNSAAVADASVTPTALQLTGGRATVLANGTASHGFTGCPACNVDATRVTRYAWAWGDGQTTANSTNVTHDYTAVGNYAVKLTVTVIGGATDDTIHTVRVSAAPVSLVKNPGVIVIASIGDPQYLDPAIDYETAGNEIVKNVYERLVQRRVG